MTGQVIFEVQADLCNGFSFQLMVFMTLKENESTFEFCPFLLSRNLKLSVSNDNSHQLFKTKCKNQFNGLFPAIGFNNLDIISRKI